MSTWSEKEDGKMEKIFDLDALLVETLCELQKSKLWKENVNQLLLICGMLDGF